MPRIHCNYVLIDAFQILREHKDINKYTIANFVYPVTVDPNALFAIAKANDFPAQEVVQQQS